MSVSAKVTIICKDLAEGFSGGTCTVPAGSCIRDALEACLAEGDVSFTADLDYLTVCLRNGKRALYEDEVEQGDQIYILRKVFGG